MRFEDAMHLAGLLPKDVVADGRWRRCPTKDKPKHSNGAYVLFDWGVGYYRNRATDGGENHKWTDGAKVDHTPSAAHLEGLRRRHEQDRQYRLQAMRKAREFWSRSTPLAGPHPYLQRKGLSTLGCAGLRANHGLLVVPVRIGEQLVSVQTISADGEKLFWPGAPVKAGCHTLLRQKSALTAFVEGLATGLAVLQCVPQASVVVAFDAGNLLPVVQAIRPTGSVVIAGDNDWKTQSKRGFNPGIDKATNAADLIGAGVAYPDDIEGSDWADALKEYGATGRKRIERQILAKAKYVGAHDRPP